jgi:hypothetical protein
VIEQYSFALCAGLTVLELPSSLQRIENRAFQFCTSLTGKLIIPPFVSYIHDNAFEGCYNLTGVQQAIREHRERFESWKARGNALMTLIRFDEEYRRVVGIGNTLHSEKSNVFLAGVSSAAKNTYLAAGHVDGADRMANGICRLIISFLPKHRKYYGTMETNEEVDRRIEEERE